MDDFPLTELIIKDWGVLDYQDALLRQQELQQKIIKGEAEDTLILVEHPPVVTLGRRGSQSDLKKSEADFIDFGVSLQNINRGGLATAHELGQLVVYPVVELKRKDVRWYADTFLQVVIAVLGEYGLCGRQKKGEPGVWVNDNKICSFGISIKKWVSAHGIALNVNNNLKTFDLIIPCGQPDEQITSISQALGHELDMAEVKQRFVDNFLDAFAYQVKD